MQVSEPLSTLQTDSASISDPAQGDQEVDMDVAPPQPPPIQQPALPFVHDVLGTHNWGAGHNMMETEQDGQQQEEAQDQQPQQQPDYGKRIVPVSTCIIIIWSVQYALHTFVINLTL